MASDNTVGIKGFIGPLRDFQVNGWAFDPAAPDESLSICVEVDDENIGTTTANLFFEHLAKAGIGKGNHGFVFNADQRLPAETPDRIKVVARSQSGGTARLIFSSPPPSPASSSSDTMQSVTKPMLLFQAASTDMAQHPVFVLGSARSGTSAVAQALTRNTRYVGHGEGHLLDLLPTLLNTVSSHYTGRYEEWASGINTMIAAVPQEFILDAIRHGFVELARTMFPSGFWLEKTPRPEMTRAAPILLNVWPDARFIYMKRRAFENIESRRRKFPDVNFETHCAGWTDSIVAWEAIRTELADRAIEIDQLILSREPKLVAKTITTFLSLTEVERKRLEQALTVDQPERTSDRFAQTYNPRDLPWTANQWSLFHENCSDAMRLAGYSETADYFLTSVRNGLDLLRT